MRTGSQIPKPNADVQDLPDGYRLTELGPLPEEWRVVRLGEVGKVITGKTPPTSESAYWNGRIPFITPVDLKSSAIRFAQRSITEAGLKYAKPLQRGAVLVSCIGYIGKVGVVDVDVAVANQQINAVIPLSVDIWFLAYALMQETNLLNSRARMTTVPILHKSNFERVPIPLPPLAEQLAIAQVLRTVQQAKEAGERVVAALKELKKSLMRHLFTCGPVAVDVRATGRSPQRDTELGPIPAHWEVVRLGEVCRVFSGFAFKSSDFVRTGIPVIKIGNLQNETVILDKETSYFPLIKITPSIKQFMLSEGDILIALTGATTGKIAVVPFELRGSLLNQRVGKFEVINAEIIGNPFLKYTCLQDYFQQKIRKGILQSAQGNISPKYMEHIQIALPPLAEQREIARILQAVDRRIAAEEAWGRAVEDLFRSLLHDLMTARRRLPPEFMEFVGAMRRIAPTGEQTP